MIKYLKFCSIVVAIISVLILLGFFFFYKFFPAKEKIPEKNVEKPAYMKNYGSENAPDAPFSMPSVVAPDFPEKICNIENYGAVEGGETANTQAFEKAISDCSQSGGGYVIVPKGKWLTGKINLKSNINLHFEDGAEITFSANRSDYLPTVFTRFQGMELYNFSPLIYGKDCENVAITGNGKLIGNGEPWDIWSKKSSSESRDKLFKMSVKNIPVEKRIFGTEKSGLRPSFIQFINSKKILLEDFYILNGPMWTIHPIYSENIIIRNLLIETFSSNTDGIVIDSSKNVYIKNTDFSTGDDGIAIKSGLEEDGFRVNRPSENIIVSSCHFISGHGALALGSELSGGIRNILFENSQISGNDNGLRIKTTQSRGGFVENVWLNNIDMQEINNESVVFDTDYTSKLGTKAKRNSVLRNISIKNIYAKNSNTKEIVEIILIKGDEKIEMNDILFENINLNSKKGMDLNRANNITFSNISLENETTDPILKMKNCANISVKNLDCQKNKGRCVSIKGSRSHNIDLRENSFGKNSVYIEKSAEKAVLIK